MKIVALVYSICGINSGTCSCSGIRFLAGFTGLIEWEYSSSSSSSSGGCSSSSGGGSKSSDKCSSHSSWQ